jgi:hypothetical protein
MGKERCRICGSYLVDEGLRVQKEALGKYWRSKLMQASGEMVCPYGCTLPGHCEECRYCVNDVCVHGRAGGLVLMIEDMMQTRHEDCPLEVRP